MNPDTRFGPVLRTLLVGLALALGLPSAPSWGACTAGSPNANLVEATPTADFTANGDGTVTHLKTGLMWKQCAEGLSGAACGNGAATQMTWANALAAAVVANSANFAGKSDWRLPNVKELNSIVETCGSFPAINTALFPNTPLGSGADSWSATTFVQNGASAWIVTFGSGFENNGFKSFPLAYARLVRGGKLFDSFDSLNNTGCTLDIDGNGVIDALTDGLLSLRAQFGLKGTAVTTGAIGAGATRTTWAQIRVYLNANCGTNFLP